MLGRFAHIGLPFPHVLAPFVGAVEIAAGGALILNLYAGDAALLAAGRDFDGDLYDQGADPAGASAWPLCAAEAGPLRVLSFIHEARTDLCMLFGLVAILLDSGMKLGLKKR